MAPLGKVNVPRCLDTADGSVIYAFVCTDVSNASWAVGRRFSDVERCHQSLSKTFPPCKKLKFPKKTFGKASAKTVEKRRQELCVWAATLVQISKSDSNVAAAFEQFLVADGTVDADTCAQLGVVRPAASVPVGQIVPGTATDAAELSRAALAQRQAQQEADAARGAAQAAARAEAEAAVAAAALAEAHAAAAQTKAAATAAVVTPAGNADTSAQVDDIKARARAIAEERVKRHRSMDDGSAVAPAATSAPTNAPTSGELSRKEKIKAAAREKAQARMDKLRASRGSLGDTANADVQEGIPPPFTKAPISGSTSTHVESSPAKAAVPESVPHLSTKASEEDCPVMVTHIDSEESPVLVKLGDSGSKRPLMTKSSEWELVSMESESSGGRTDDNDEGVPPSSVPTTAATTVEPAAATAAATASVPGKPSRVSSAGSAAPFRFDHGMSWLEVWAKASQITSNTSSASSHTTVRAVPANGSTSTPFVGYTTRVSGQNYTVVTGGLTTRVH